MVITDYTSKHCWTQPPNKIVGRQYCANAPTGEAESVVTTDGRVYRLVPHAHASHVIVGDRVLPNTGSHLCSGYQL